MLDMMMTSFMLRMEDFLICEELSLRKRQQENRLLISLREKNLQRNEKMIHNERLIENEKVNRSKNLLSLPHKALWDSLGDN